MTTIQAGDVIRWFCVDWEFFGGPQAGTAVHDEVFDKLGAMRNAVEVNSGHTGVNVAFCNIRRPDAEVIAAIKRRLAKFAA